MSITTISAEDIPPLMQKTTMEEKIYRKKVSSLRKSRGRPHIIEDRCKGCGFCIAFCPTKVLKVSERFNVKGYHPPEFVESPSDKVCIACKFCEMICPDFAIYVEVFENEK